MRGKSQAWGGQGEDASAPRQGPVQGRGEREGDCYGETSRQVAVTPELAGRYLGEFSIACEQVENGRPGLRATHFPHFNSPPPPPPLKPRSSLLGQRRHRFPKSDKKMDN